MSNTLPALIIILMWSGSLLIASLPLALSIVSQSVLQIALTIAVAPLIFAFSFVTIGGILSNFARHAIIPGTFPRENFHKIYFWRRVYGTTWTQLFYFSPLYSICLAVPLFKKYMLYLYGYRGISSNFVVYPDTWLRDLPVLQFGDKAYLSNKATIGTNMCLTDGTILVDKVSVGTAGLVGHLAMIAPGAVIGEHAEIGVGCSIGIRAIIKPYASIKPDCVINHGAIIGEGTSIGALSHIGMRAKIGAGIKIPPGSNIKAGTIVENQDQLDALLKLEIQENISQMSKLVAKHHSKVS